MAQVTHLVVDSGGFILNPSLQDVGKNIVTLREVVDEIKDKATKQRLQVLPYELEFRQPSSQAMRIVSEFARKTGDYASLSITDLMVLAVTYDVTVEKVGSSHLNKEPVTQRTIDFYKPGVQSLTSDKKIAGFFIPNSEDKADDDSPKEEQFDSFNFWREPLPDLPIDLDVAEDPSANHLSHSQSTAPAHLSPNQLAALDSFLLERSYMSGYGVSCADFAVLERVSGVNAASLPHVHRWQKHIRSHADDRQQPMPAVSVDAILEKVQNGVDFDVHDVLKVERRDDPVVAEEENNDDSYDEGVQDLDNSDKENECVDSDEDGWITPSNLKEKKAAMGGSSNPNEKVEVGCMTTDFAMQNVLKQMGLSIIGTNGMLIKETKTWILRCYGCFHTTPLMEKVFCPRCGNKTLKRVSVTLNDDGTQQIHISTRRPLSKKGKKFSLPAPKGGKHSVNPKLVADQREAQQRISKKAMARNNPLDPDYICGGSPFAVKDVTSKSAMLGLKAEGKGQAHIPGMYWNRKNPNAGSKKTGNRK